MPGDFDEAKHPRAEDGKFSQDGSSGTGRSGRANELARAARARARVAPSGTTRVAKGEKFNAKPHERRIARFRTQEAKLRTQSIAIKQKMAALKADAKLKAITPHQRARLKARFEKLAARRDEIKMRAAAAKEGRGRNRGGGGFCALHQQAKHWRVLRKFNWQLNRC